MKFIVLFFILVTFELNFSQSRNYFTIDNIYEMLGNLKTTEKDLQTIVDCLSTAFRDGYSFNQIAKNPPQPSFNSSYYIKVDIQEELKKVNLKNVTMFQFYQQIKLLFDRLSDKHLSINMKKIPLKDILFIDPVKLVIKQDDNNKTRIFGEIKIDKEEYQYFKNNDTIFNMIEKNKEIPIKEINGKDPFDYITYFGGDYERFRSPHACFRVKFFYNNRNFNFQIFPLDKGNLTDLTFTYDNGDSFTTNYMVYSEKSISLVQISENIKLFFDNIVKNLEKKDDIKKNNIFKDLFIIKNNQMYINLFDEDNFAMNRESETVSLASNNYWTYNYNNFIACRVDDKKKINMFGLTSYSNNTDITFMLTIRECTKLFDKNNYPIILVNVLNGGGLVYNSQFLLEALSPNVELNLYARQRDTDVIQDNEITEQMAISFASADDCKPFGTYKEMLKNKQFVDYGNSVNDTLLSPIIFNGKDFRALINELKESLKNRRKPTEILVYTDGFSYSAASLLLKHLQYYGGGITVGYFVNPNLDSIPFDSSLSPSSVNSDEILKSLNPKGYDTLSKNYGFSMTMTGTQTFFSEKDYQVPLEFLVTPVDEKVNLYINKDLKNPQDLMDSSIYEPFVDEALKYFEKYKTQCNPNNKKLLLITSECDGKFKEHVHGGYECDENGFWTKNCVPSYCDIGYIFDFEKKECIENVCNPNNNVLVFLIILIIIIVLSITASVFVFIVIKQKGRSENQGLLETDTI